MLLDSSVVPRILQGMVVRSWVGLLSASGLWIAVNMAYWTWPGMFRNGQEPGLKMESRSCAEAIS